MGNKTVDQRSGANLKKHVFCKNLLHISCFLGFFAAKMLKMTISTSVWSAQHPKAGRNIQHLVLHLLPSQTNVRDFMLENDANPNLVAERTAINLSILDKYFN